MNPTPYAAAIMAPFTPWFAGRLAGRFARQLALLLCLAVTLSAADLTTIAPGLRLAIPETWARELAADRRTQVWRHPDHADVSIAVLVQATDDERDAAEHVDEALTLLARLGTGYALIDPVTSDATMPGWLIARYRFTTGAVEWEQVIRLRREPARIIAITCSTPRQSASEWTATFASMCEVLTRVPSGLSAP
jgi:hypothetical protein